jgi:hypothetical protein
MKLNHAKLKLHEQQNANMKLKHVKLERLNVDEIDTNRICPSLNQKVFNLMSFVLLLQLGFIFELKL